LAELKPEDIVEIYANLALGRDLAADLKERFSLALDEEALNASHQIVVVASEIDESTSRIVNYLNDRDIPINVPVLEQQRDGLAVDRRGLLRPRVTGQRVN